MPAKLDAAALRRADMRYCEECGDLIINEGAHAEQCPGPFAHGKCECPPGWRHEPDCPVTR